jgi:hypothetical protein
VARFRLACLFTANISLINYMANGVVSKNKVAVINYTGSSYFPYHRVYP